jgi:hypothetical protein
MSNELLALFRKTAALLDGSFVLRSGLHSRQFFQYALLLQQTEVAARPCGTLADKARGVGCDAMISPPFGGIIAGQEVSHPLRKRHIFAEKYAGSLLLRRGIKIAPNDKFMVVEDVVQRSNPVADDHHFLNQERLNCKKPDSVVCIAGVLGSGTPMLPRSLQGCGPDCRSRTSPESRNEDRKPA